MSGARRRLEALEARGAKQGTVSTEALSRLSGEDLDALAETLWEGIESGACSFEDLFAATQEQSRRGLDEYFAALEAVRNGAELPDDLRGGRTLKPLERIYEGDEEAKAEYEKRDGYRIWKYYRKEQHR